MSDTLNKIQTQIDTQQITMPDAPTFGQTAQNLMDVTNVTGNNAQTQILSTKMKNDFGSAADKIDE